MRKPLIPFLKALMALIAGCLIPVCTHLGVLTRQTEMMLSLGIICSFAVGLFYVFLERQINRMWRVSLLGIIFLPMILWMIYVYSHQPEVFRYFDVVVTLLYPLSFLSGYVTAKKKFPVSLISASAPLILVVLIWYAIWPRLEYAIRNNTEEKPIPVPFNENYPLISSTGDTIYTDSFRGKVVMIDFWAPYCSACYEKIDELEKAGIRAKKNAEIFIVEPGVHYLHQNSLEDVKEFQKKTSFKVLFDIDGRFSKHLRVEGIPEDFIFDKDGKIIHRFTGYNETVRSLYIKKIETFLSNGL